jgi:adenosylcobinamide kinase / adenosylcobinamide-phosphate guanylyltransferase
MFFVTGGAFNGKGAWVRKKYQITEENSIWKSTYRNQSFNDNFDQTTKTILIFEGIELEIKKRLESESAENVQQSWRSFLVKLLEWEEASKGRLVILIGSDITKGIVPVDKEERNWRDVTGRVFQDTSLFCERVDLIWYGLQHRLK